MRLRPRPRNDGEIDLEAIELAKKLGRVAGDQAQADLGIALAEAANERQHMGGGIGADAKASLLQAPGTRKQLEGFGFGLEHALGYGKELARELGEFDPTPTTQEEFGPIGLFELADMVRNRGLSECQPASGFGKATMG